MATTIPLHYIEKVKKNDRLQTRFRVADIVLMHIKNGSPIAWIAENFGSLDYAKIHAALAYYYDHQAEIEDEITAMLAADDEVANTALDFVRLKDKITKRKG